MDAPRQHEPPPVPVHVRVVGVALLRTGPSGREVLAARRTRPEELAGRWELPGGKCRSDETLPEAARRELAEELGVTVRVTGSLAGVEPIREGLTLEVVTGEVVDGTPVATEHDALRWVSASALRELAWLDPDVPFLDEIEQLLARDEEGR